MSPVFVAQGDLPLVLAQPHGGTFVPDDIRADLNAVGRRLRDTDWHIPELYDGLVPGASVVRAGFSRYVIDANRAPDDGDLYPGQNTTGLIPQHDFDGAPIWRTAPDDRSLARRLEEFHRPYHAALRAELERLRARHGFVVLYDCHSIRSRIPFLFDGQLPDLNIGTNGGASCAPAIERAVVAVCAASTAYTSVLNGRFRGGWTTRHYGRPEDGVHAIQMEIVQRAYLESETEPFAYDAAAAARLRDLLGQVLHAALASAGDLE